MGVMGCDRNECTNTMCNHLSSDYGYICQECLEELIELGPETDIANFMDSDKNRKKYNYSREESKKYFETIFIDREEE
jgi:hypothetical protein